MGIFAKIKAALKKTKDAIAYRLNKLFTGGVLNDEFYDELETLLLSADIGSETTENILDELKKATDKKHLTRPEQVQEGLQEKRGSHRDSSAEQQKQRHRIAQDGRRLLRLALPQIYAEPGGSPHADQRRQRREGKFRHEGIRQGPWRRGDAPFFRTGRRRAGDRQVHDRPFRSRA